MIEFEQVSFAFSEQIMILKNLNLTLEAKTFYVLRGPSGVGKSTFLRLLSLMELPDSGTIRYCNKPLTDYFAPALRQEILYLQQTPIVVSGTVRDNLLLSFQLKNNQKKLKPTDEKLSSLMEALSLDELSLDGSAETLSEGQKQRLCFLRGVVLEPRVMLLDEPTSALDADSAERLELMVEDLNMVDGVTIVMIRHRRFNPVSVSPVILELSGDGALVDVS